MEFKTEYTVEELETHRRDWIAALRSGNFRQTCYDLKNEHGYCCLGVACEIAGITPVLNTTLSGDSYYRFNDSRSSLPIEVKKYYGFNNSLGGISGDYNNTLSSLNDTDRLTFEKIADFVEENWDKVFTND